MGSDGIVGMTPFDRRTYLGKVTKAFIWTPSGSEAFQCSDDRNIVINTTTTHQ